VTEDQWLSEIARTCRSCPECWEVPCGGCQQGGVCDAICHCYRHDNGDEHDEQDQP